MASIPQELAEYHLEELATAYYATVEALLLCDQEWIAKGLDSLVIAIRSANEGIDGYLNGN